MFCLKICQALGLGASCVTTVSSEGKRRFLIDKFPWLQPQQVIVRERATNIGIWRRRSRKKSTPTITFAAQLNNALDFIGRREEGFDVVMDAIGGAYFEDMFSVVARGGRFVTFGSADFTPTKDRIDWPKLIWKYLRRPKVDVMALPSANKLLLLGASVMMFFLLLFRA